MDFNEVRLEKLSESALGVFYKGLTNNFYDLKNINLSEEENIFALFLENLIQRKASFSELQNFNVPENFLNDFRENIVSVIELNGLLEKIPSKKIFISLLESLIRLISKVNFVSDKALFSEIVLHNSIGLKQLSFFSLEKDFEELMINSLDEVFVFHKDFGFCKTNIVLDEKKFNNILQRIAQSVGKDFNKSNPLLDARLPDGSRVNATMDNVSAKGISLTIRKFSTIPLTIIDLIKDNILSVESAAFLWLMVDGFGINPKNILVIGGTASGKTTLLSILTNFIRLSERVISIEDTLELSLLDRKNWVALEAKHSKDEEINMDDLLKNALRMRPDRIIVGEVRGNEALTLFTAMDNGHAGCLGTIHANNARESINKLSERPFDVPKSHLALIDLIVVMKKIYSKNKGVSRHVSQIAEVSKMDDKILLANVFELNNSILSRTNLPSHIIEEFALENSMEKNDLKKEIETRQLVLSWMIENNIHKPKEVLEVIQSYYFDSEKVLSSIYESLK
ncbi:MAG: ATPase, T2SS/T4P/T4SS family [Candidatus ainarchaeum sp.]|nr:ATPase, T2SS/T4P/T4SS family [Candidatus ainarchaeum sp.]